jgi:membrane protein
MKKTETSKLATAIRFLKTDIWRIQARKLPKRKSFFIRQARIFLLAFSGFAEDLCQLRASALTFYTLLSIVPIAAMAFGIAKGFGFEKMLEQLLLERFPGQQEVLNQVIGFSNSLLANTQGGLIAGVGIIILFYTVVKVLGSIEDSFNDIWGVKVPRSFTRKFSDYMSIMLICPILLIMASSATVVVASELKVIIERFVFLGWMGKAIIFALNVLPFAVVWIVFTFIYMFMPNTKVNFKAGLFGGIVAGTLYQIAQWTYIKFQVQVLNYGAVYGSFAALPLFLIWLQTSWLIVLFGAEISFAEQNVETYEFEPDCLKVSHEFKKLLSLHIMHRCVKNFHQGKKPLSVEEINHEMEIPIRLVRQILFELIECGLLTEVKAFGSSTLLYQPAISVERLTVLDVISCINQNGIDNIPVAETAELDHLKNVLEKFQETLAKSPSNKLLKEI